MINNAQAAIDCITDHRITFLGVDVQRYNGALEIRGQLLIMAEDNKITPSAYYRALQITYPDMTSGMLRAEIDQLGSI